MPEYFTIDEFRSRYADNDDDLDAYDDETIERYRSLAEEAFEDATGRAFVPRNATESIGRSPSPYGGLRLHKRDLRRLVSAADAADATIDVGTAQLRNGWVDGLPAGVAVLTYEYGLDQPPLRVKYAVMALTRQWMVKGPIDDRNTQLATEGGGAINLATPGMFGSTFGLPEVDVCVRLYGAASTALA